MRWRCRWRWRRAPSGALRLDGEHRGVRRRLRRARRPARGGDRARGEDRDRQARAGADARRAGDRAARQLRPGAESSASSSERHPIALVNSLNPFRIEGQKTAAFEVCDQLGEAPDVLAIPVGNAGNVTAWWTGFREYEVAPRLHGYQAEGAAPLVQGRAGRAPGDRRVGDPDREPGALGGGDRRDHGVARRDPRGLGRGDPGRVRVRWASARASSASRPRRLRWRGSASRGRGAGGVRADGARAEGPTTALARAAPQSCRASRGLEVGRGGGAGVRSQVAGRRSQATNGGRL